MIMTASLIRTATAAAISVAVLARSVSTMTAAVTVVHLYGAKEIDIGVSGWFSFFFSPFFPFSIGFNS